MSVSGYAYSCSYTIDYTFYADATVDMKVTFSPSGNLARMGLGMQFAEGMEDVEYYGRGPWSNYSDRKTGSFLGRYQTTVDDMLDEMIHPQTYGDHQDLRDLTLRNLTNGVSLNVQTEGQVSFSLGHYDETRWCTYGARCGTHSSTGTISLVTRRFTPTSTISSADLATTHAAATAVSASTPARHGDHILTPCVSHLQSKEVLLLLIYLSSRGQELKDSDADFRFLPTAFVFA